MKSYLLSTLATQLAAKPPPAFTQAHPNDWLVWEPGAWRPAQSATVLTARAQASAVPPGGEGLALALLAMPRRANQLVLGRGEDCDLCVNDGTLSQRHLLLMRDAEGWTVRDAGSRNGTKLAGTPLVPGTPARLKEGARIEAGHVRFTFHTSEGLLARLKQG